MNLRMHTVVLTTGTTTRGGSYGGAARKLPVKTDLCSDTLERSDHWVQMGSLARIVPLNPKETTSRACKMPADLAKRGVRWPR